MTEAVEQVPLHRLPLNEFHVRLGASMAECHGWSVPASYGDELFEYAAIREGGAGVIDLSPRGRLRVSGSEAVQFLNGLITNDVKTLDVNRWMPAAFLNAQGRLLASIRVLHCKDEACTTGFLIDTEAPTHERVLQILDRFTLAGDFRLRDLTDEMTLFSVQGAKAAPVISRVLGETAAGLSRGAVATVSRQSEEVTIIRATHTAEDGFDLFVSAKGSLELWDSLIGAGARPVGYDAFDRLRIEAGVPRYGIDMDEASIATEAGLDEAVSFTKGCYIGQEIIARIRWRGHVAKKLSGVVFEQATKVESNASIRSTDEKPIGRVTSAVYSPHLGRTIALAYLKFDYLAPGTGLKVISGASEHAAQVAELPLARGSWYTADPSG